MADSSSISDAFALVSDLSFKRLSLILVIFGKLFRGWAVSVMKYTLLRGANRCLRWSKLELHQT